MTVYNEKPHPRALFIGFDEEDETELQQIANLFPHSKSLHPYELKDIDQKEYDFALVSADVNVSDLMSHLYVVGLDNDDLGKQERDQYYGAFYSEISGSVATEFVVSPEIDNHDLKKLVEETLIPVYLNETHHTVLTSRLATSVMAGHVSFQTAALWIPLVSDKNGSIFSGHAIRSTKLPYAPELWFLPSEIEYDQLKRWIVFLLERWSDSNPASFSVSADWTTSSEWMTRDEVLAQEAIEIKKLDFQKVESKHAGQLIKLEAALVEAKAKADKTTRKLLTSQGDDLKDIVKDTLESFGFKMTDVDKEILPETKSEKLDDLRAQTSFKDKDWTGMIEVRGYKKGARLNDLLRLNRFTIHFMEANGGKRPDGIWYIANHDLSTNPTSRQLALEANPTEVKEFSQSSGVVIDTRELFKLKTAFDAGDIDAETAKELLINASGYFIYE